MFPVGFQPLVTLHSFPRVSSNPVHTCRGGEGGGREWGRRGVPYEFVLVVVWNGFGIVEAILGYVGVWFEANSYGFGPWMTIAPMNSNGLGLWMAIAHEFVWLGALDDHFPYEFIWFKALDGHFPYEFIGFGAMDPYEFIGFGAIHGTNPYESTGVGAG